MSLQYIHYGTTIKFKAEYNKYPYLSFSDNEVSEKLQEAMEKGYIETRLILLVLVGVAGSGKTHFMYLVLGLDPPMIRVSTPLAEAAVRSMSICYVSIEGVQWHFVDQKAFQDKIADAIKKGMPPDMLQDLQELTPKITFGDVENYKDVDSAISDDRKVPRGSKKASMLSRLKSLVYKPSKSRIPQKTGQVSPDIIKILPEMFDALESVHGDLLQQIRNSSGTGSFFDMEWVYIVDSGGQPQFREMLPHFMYDSSAFVMMQKLNESLRSTTSIEYLGEGGEMLHEPYQSQLTNEQILYQYFQAIQSHKSQVFVVGTFRDKENDCSETRADKDKKLLEAFRPVVGNNIALYQPGNTDQFIFPFNCKTPEPQDKVTAEKFRKTVIDLCPKKKF